MTDLTQRARNVAERLKAWPARNDVACELMDEAAATISELVERIEGVENKPRDIYVANFKATLAKRRGPHPPTALAKQEDQP